MDASAQAIQERQQAQNFGFPFGQRFVLSGYRK